MKKLIKIKCFDDGTAKLTTSALHIEGENLASAIQLDFSETAFKSATKFVDIINGKYKARYELGDAEIVEHDLSYEDTTPGCMVITPFIFDGMSKAKYKPNFSVQITRQPDVTTENKPNTGDYLLELREMIYDRLEKGSTDTENTYIYAYDKSGQKQLSVDEFGGRADAVSVSTENFTNLLSKEADTVQKALDELDKSTEAIDLESITNLFN